MSERAIVLEIPASSAYLALVRSAASAVCARLDYPVDQLDDIALAAGEAAGLMLKDAQPGSRLQVSLTPHPQQPEPGLTIAVAAHTNSGRVPRQDSFSWNVLTALVDRVQADLAGDRVTLTLHSRRYLGGLS